MGKPLYVPSWPVEAVQEDLKELNTVVSEYVASMRELLKAHRVARGSEYRLMKMTPELEDAFERFRVAKLAVDAHVHRRLIPNMSKLDSVLAELVTAITQRHQEEERALQALGKLIQPRRD